jgi:hypothetical protein
MPERKKTLAMSGLYGVEVRSESSFSTDQPVGKLPLLKIVILSSYTRIWIGLPDA